MRRLTSGFTTGFGPVTCLVYGTLFAHPRRINPYFVSQIEDIVMEHKDLPDRWKKKLKDYLTSQGESERDMLTAYDFSARHVAKIKFEDDSYVEFFYPLVIEASELNEVGIFTEHCGYHIFNMYGIHLSVEPKSGSLPFECW